MRTIYYYYTQYTVHVLYYVILKKKKMLLVNITVGGNEKHYIIYIYIHYYTLHGIRIIRDEPDTCRFIFSIESLAGRDSCLFSDFQEASK